MRDQWEHFVDGNWCLPKAGRYLDSSNPATGEHVTRVASGDADDVAADHGAVGDDAQGCRLADPERTGEADDVEPWRTEDDLHALTVGASRRASAEPRRGRPASP